jgi:hypothetical protein
MHPFPRLPKQRRGSGPIEAEVGGKDAGRIHAAAAVEDAVGAIAALGVGLARGLAAHLPGDAPVDAAHGGEAEARRRRLLDVAVLRVGAASGGARALVRPADGLAYPLDARRVRVAEVDARPAVLRVAGEVDALPVATVWRRRRAV